MRINALGLLDKAEWNLNHNLITVGEYEKLIEPLRDIEIVVRCRDCKYWAGNGTDPSELPYFLPCKGITRSPDYFCADAERR